MHIATDKQTIVYDVVVDGEKLDFNSSIEEEITATEAEIVTLNETISSIEKMKPDCDRVDYALAVSSGVICSFFDIFLVGKAGESAIGKLTDKWFEDRTKDFARLCGWTPETNDCASSAIKFLENKFDVPYDQRGAGDAGSAIYKLTPTNHHFKSLGHNPSLLGLFFSVLDQFSNESHFVSGGQLIALQQADADFALRGFNLPSKLFCGFANWFGHLFSDVCGSSGSKGRGMGIPSPLWSWSNNAIAIKRSLRLPVGKFDMALNELALELYVNGYDARFQAAQAIPVFVNELIVRLLYCVRRLIKYFSEEDKTQHSWKQMWAQCEPFKSPSVKRMLTVAHASFLAIDVGDAVIRSLIAGGGSFNPTEFFMRLNIVGVGRMAISLYDEVNRGINIQKAKHAAQRARNEQAILENYIVGLRVLAKTYDDELLLNMLDDIQNEYFVSAFQKSIQLAQKWQAPADRILETKADIDAYFRKGRKL